MERYGVEQALQVWAGLSQGTYLEIQMHNVLMAKKGGTALHVRAGLFQGTYLEIQMYNVLMDR